MERIEKFNPELNAIVTPDYENARAAAKKADSDRAKGVDAPLLGLPLTIKDCIDVAGLPGTAGVEAFADRVPGVDSRLAARVREAGGVIIGKTNVPPYAADWQSSNPVFGRTNNPWDLGRTPGGSTGGGAAAVAAGMSPLEFGSDIGGSIRVPAAFCGIYGHKPSETALARSGHFPGTPLPNPAVTMAVQGPLARTAEDLALGLGVVSGPDVGEDVAWRLEIPPPRHDRLSDFRVAVMPPVEWLPVDDEILAAQERVVEALRSRGASFEVAQPATFGDLRGHHKVYSSILGLMTSSGSAEERNHLASNMRATGDEFQIAMANGIDASGADFLGWLQEREHIRASYREFFVDWDVLIAPITIVPAFPHTDAPWPRRKVNVNGAEVSYGLQDSVPSGGHTERSTRDGVPDGPDTFRPAHRPPSNRPISRRPHANTVRFTPRGGVPRIPTSTRVLTGE